MKNQTILVVGASGTVGTELVRQLKAKGLTVKAATSKTPSGPDQVQLDLLTGRGLKEAFEGVGKAFFLSPPGHADQYQMLSPLIQEAKRRGLQKVVLMTAMGANADESSPFRRAEVELEKSGLRYNIIRPNWFMQNFNTFWIHGIQQTGKIMVPGGRAKVSFIDARDISSVAAELLTSSQFDNQAFELTGSESVDHDQAAAVLSKVTGKKISYQDMDPSVFRGGLIQAGLPKDYADLLLKIFGYLREGYATPVVDNVKMILGREPLSLEQYARDFKDAWK